MARDKFTNYPLSPSESATLHYQIVAAATPLDPRPRAIRADGSGTITITDEGGTSLVYTMVAGEKLPFRGVKVTALTGGPFYAWI